jgi:predicted aldo/keto reductase-like oxidoreductase
MAGERGMAVLVNRPFGGGNVFAKLSKTSLPAWAADFDCESWGQFMLKYVLSHPAVTCTIPGMTKARHVEDNMMAATGRMPNADQRRAQESFFDAL